MAKIYRKRGNKLNEVVTFDSACTRQENQPLVYDATDGSVHTTTHIGCLDADDVSINNLTVTGQAIIQEQVTDTIGSNTLVLRSNADAGLAGSENSGLIIHNYNGSADLYAVTDNTGTFRVGTAVSTTTTYPYLRYNETDNKWYSTAPEVTPAVEVTPVGSPTSWDSVVTSGDDVEYTNIVFSVIDRTSLEPLTTRDESTDMEESYLTKWDSTDEKIITTGTSCTHDLCANGDITSTGDITADGNVCVKTDITVDGNSCLKGNSTIDGNSCVKGTSTVSGEIHSCDCLTAPTACISDDLYVAGDINNCNTNSVIHGYNGCFENNFCIKGDLSVDGFATISGLMSDYVATAEDTTTNDWEYLTFVPTNHLTKGRNPVYTDGDLKYNPYSNTLYMGNACVTGTACITCACVGNECVNNLCIGTVVTNANATESATYCVSSITGNTDFAIPLYNKDITNLNTDKTAKLSYTNSATAPRYNPNTNTFCACNFRATDYVTAGSAVVTTNVSSTFMAELPAGSNSSIGIYTACKDAQGNATVFTTTLCGTDGKIYNNYGFVGPNNYHCTLPGANGGTAYFEVIPVTDSSAALCFDIYNTHYKIELYKDDYGKWCTKNFFDNRTLTEVSCNYLPYGALKWSPDTNGNKLYFSYTDYRPLTITADQNITVNVCSSNPTTYGYRSSTACRQSLGEYLYDWGNYGCVYRYDGVLYGAQSISAPEVTIYQDDYPTYYGFWGCLNAWTRGMFISPLYGVGSDNPFMLGDVYSRLPYNQNRNISTINGFNGLIYGCIPSYNTKSAQCSTNYTYNKGFLISGGMCVNNSCQASGYVMGLVGQYDETVSFEGLPRAVYGVRNFCCLTCRTETGVWTDDKFYELIDDRGGQTINGTLSATTFCGNFCGPINGNATNLDASGADVYPVGTCSARLWSSSITDSYGICSGDWAHRLSMSHGDYDTYYGLSMALPFWEHSKFTWRVRNAGNLGPVHELIDSRGGQTIEGNLTVHNGGNNTILTVDKLTNSTGTVVIPNNDSNWGEGLRINRSVAGGQYVTFIIGADNNSYGGACNGFWFGNKFSNKSCLFISYDNHSDDSLSYFESVGDAYGTVKWHGDVTANTVQVGSAVLASTSTYPISIVCGDQHILLSCTCSISIGCNASSTTYGVALGNQAYANARSFAVGSFACACAEDTIAIGATAKASMERAIAIGKGACAECIGDVCVQVDEKAYSLRRTIISWSFLAKQCDLFNAICSRFDFNTFAPNDNTVYIGIQGNYGCNSLLELKWDKNESPLNYDLGRPGSTDITIYKGCTDTIPKAGYVQIIGYVR